MNLNWKKLATRVGLRAIAEAQRQPTAEDVDVRSAIALNKWARTNPEIPQGELPFPFIHDGNKEMSNAYEFPENAWGWVWLQRSFWVRHLATDIRVRMINGRGSPQDVTD